MSFNYEPFPPERPRPHPLLACLPFVLFMLLVALAGYLFWQYWPWGGGTGLNPHAEPRAVTARGALSPLEQANIQIYEKDSPSLVQVTNLTEVHNWFGLDVQAVPKGVGSGFVWDRQGHIVTNYHVVQGADTVQVTLADHSTYETQQIWAYPGQDIAVLWINAPAGALHPIPIGSSHNLKVGQIVYTLGDPFGLDETMTTGIISALGREMTSESGRTLRGLIQTSAAINPGNSGGPLLDSAGRLIGMNSAIVSPSGAFAGIGFAIPVDEINRIVPQLIRHGKVVRPRIGVQIAPYPIAKQLGVDRGAVILKVLPDSPASEAGLQGTRRDRQGRIHLGDVIVGFNGTPINNVDDLYAALEHHQAGDTVTLTVLRDGERQDVKVTLGASE
jgi:S1-C subfamily serine protease